MSVDSLTDAVNVTYMDKHIHTQTERERERERETRIPLLVHARIHTYICEFAVEDRAVSPSSVVHVLMVV